MSNRCLTGKSLGMTTASNLRETSDRFFKGLLALRIYKTLKDRHVYILQKNSPKETMIYIQKGI